MPLPRIALLPLDERPVNTQLVSDVAAIAGAHVDIPPAEILPAFRAAGDVDALARWLAERAAAGSDLVVSIDTLVHGGLIPARISSDAPETVLPRLARLRKIVAASPDVRISAVSLVTRASDSYSDVEEPEYWAHSGRELHALGGSSHRAWLGEAAPEVAVDPHVREDFVMRRLRNHLVNLAALRMAWEKVIDRLVITADDTATYSAGSVEQHWIEYWQQLKGTERVLVYPGADETGAVLVARMLADRAGDPIRVASLPGDPAGMELVPSYENTPLSESLARQISAVGGVDTRVEDAEVLLVVHTPDPHRADQFGGAQPLTPAEAVSVTADAVDRALATGLPVALADLRYGNGADAALVEELSRRGTLLRLFAFAGWNTAGNALGSVLALAVAGVVGIRQGTLDREARSRALHRRLLDDYAYQSVVRRELHLELFGESFAPLDEEAATRAAASIEARLRDVATRIGIPAPAHVTLPWRRSFEVDVRFRGE